MLALLSAYVLTIEIPDMSDGIEHFFLKGGSPVHYSRRYMWCPPFGMVLLPQTGEFRQNAWLL